MLSSISSFASRLHASDTAFDTALAQLSRACVLFLLASSVTLLSGCGEATLPPPTAAIVSGKVNLDGKPMVTPLRLMSDDAALIPK